MMTRYPPLRQADAAAISSRAISSASSGKKSIGISPTELEMKILTIFVSVAPMRNSASVSDGVLIPIWFPICHAKARNLRPIMESVKSCEMQSLAAFQEKQISCGNALELSVKGHYFPTCIAEPAFVVVRCCLSSVG